MDTPPTRQQVLRRHFTPGDAETLARLPFELPPRTERLTVECRVTPRAGASIRCGLFDASGLRGLWSEETKGISVARESASPGFQRGPLVPGAWSVQLLPVRLPSSGCDVEITLTFQAQHARWLKGDLHMHTNHSDGHDVTEFVVDRCRALKLDYIAITDHDTRTCHDFLPYRPDITVLPGIELSSWKGHANCIGVDSPYANGMWATEPEVKAALQAARDKGCFISINHPFDWDVGCQWRWSWDVAYDAIEIVNGPWRPTNARALEWWQKLLAGGGQLAVVGGSDAHNTYELTLTGMPTTWVYVEENSREAIVDALKKGASYLTISPKGPVLTMPGHVPGQVVHARRGSTVTVPFDLQLNPGSVVKVITRAGEAMTAKADRDTVHAEIAVKADGSDFMRVEAWEYMEEYDRSMLTLLSNPVYVRDDG